MKILYLGNSNKIHDFRFIEKLVERGYDTHIVTYTDKPIKIKGATYYSFPKVRDPIGYSRYVGDAIYLLNLIKHRSYLRKLIKTIKPDILHAVWIPTYGLMGALSGFNPFLLIAWGSDILVIPNNATYLIKKQIVWAIKKADMINCDAEHVKKEIIRLSGYPENRIIVVPHGLDLKKFNPKVDGSEVREKLGWEDYKIVIMTRSFKRLYGVEYFLKSLPELFKKNNEDVRILLCGDGPLKNDFMRYLSNKGLSKYVHFAGFIENYELPKYFAASDIYVSTSLSDGSSMSLMEAIAIGLPCVVTDLPAIKEWVVDGENGFIVPKKNSLKVAEKINELLKDEVLRKKFGVRNIKIGQEKADWDKNFDKLEWIYRELTQ